tara:strand:+ start:929 stop:2437 length:1509 start_codon:yes stop_codon:yes gene_type:complete
LGIKNLMTKNQTPTIKEAQAIINARIPEGEPHKRVIEVKREARGRDSPRVWVKIVCVEHDKLGNQGHVIRLNDKKPPACVTCGAIRGAVKLKRSISTIEAAVKKYALKRQFPLTLVKISDDKKTLTLKCEKHGENIRPTKLVVNRGQLCAKCVDQSGENNPAYIPLEEKRRKFIKRYPNSKCKILRQSKEFSKSFNVVCECANCQNEFVSDWHSIYGKNRETCTICSRLGLSKSMIKPLEEVVIELREMYLSMVNEADYRNSKKPIDIVCSNCKTQKNISLNQTFNRGFPCRCTLSIPNLCHTIIFDDVINMFEDAKSNYNFGVCIADIWMPSSQHIIEIKFGDLPFGFPDEKNSHSFDRYLKTQQQLKNYLSLNYNISYIIVGKESAMRYVPNFPHSVSVTYLNELETDDFFSQVIRRETIQRLLDLYRRPYLVRGMIPYASIAKKMIRQKLRDFLCQNGLMLPTPKKTKAFIGFGQRQLDGALGLGRIILQSDRVEACKF